MVLLPLDCSGFELLAPMPDFPLLLLISSGGAATGGASAKLKGLASFLPEGESYGQCFPHYFE